MIQLQTIYNRVAEAIHERSTDPPEVQERLESRPQLGQRHCGRVVIPGRHSQ